MSQISFLQELGFVLCHSGFTVLPEQGDFLPVEYDRSPLCRVDTDGVVFFREADVTIPDRDSACSKVSNLSSIVQEYWTLLEQAPILQAIGLKEPYKLLVEFNRTVLAGRQTENGTKFATWKWDLNHTSLSQGHYYEWDYSSAKRDFAIRAGLIYQDPSFEQLNHIYQLCCQMGSFCDSSCKQAAIIQEIKSTICTLVPVYKEQQT